MNSTSKKYVDPCHQKHDDDCCEPSRKHCKREKEKQEFVLLKVGNPLSTVIPSSAVNGNIFTVASLTTNTGDLDDPEIKIDFTANIIVGAVVPGTGATITFQVNKFFANTFSPLNAITVGPSWVYANPTPSTADIISFFVKDEEDIECGAVKYTVTATVGLATTGALGGPFSINNATLAATIAAEEEDERRR